MKCLVDVYLLDKMIARIPIPLASLIIANMCDEVTRQQAAKTFCYPLLITYILQKSGVSFVGEYVA